MKENSQERAIEEACETLKRRLEEAEAIVVGAGAGLSSAAGMSYSGERFRRHFSDFERKYGFHDMYTGGFYPFKTSEEFWAYWSRFIYLNRYSPFDESVYKNLFSLLRDKEYFVLTTNVDHCFQRTGFGKERLFYTQGDYGLFQCRVPCHDKTYDNEAVVLKMRKEEKNMTIPSALVPRCPVCGEPMTMNLRCDATFVEDAGWHAACRRYEKFIEKYREKKILFLELGVGGNTPGIIKYPFWRLTAENKRAFYACVNLENAYAPAEIAWRSLCLRAGIGEVISSIQRGRVENT
ncbi:MAG: Sir2 silent information regulator family NAD-dependent deacetylase [Clostridia bacterium]|nr:Sir2 silent information regulator family NAD-dependent deacetylase [Clostridia bacterium]